LHSGPGADGRVHVLIVMVPCHKFRKSSARIGRSASRERGYVLLTLMLSMAIIAIAQLVVLQNLAQQVQRDREEELCHRGTEYMRAIRRYYRAMGRYPARLEDLEAANGRRFIRKLYKDPMSRDPKTGQEREFKLLHPQDLMLGQLAGTEAAEKWQQALSGNLQVSDSSEPEDSEPTLSEGSDGSDDTAEEQKADGSAKPAVAPKQATPAPSEAVSSLGSAQQFDGGMPIVGVASRSNGKAIREFNRKNHYKDWYFIFDPSMVSAGLLVGPWQPANTLAFSGGTANTPQSNSVLGRRISRPASALPQNPSSPASSQDPTTP
jgi:type II secretory pathway pseudopilin PulG